jgi:hypothetical protein
MSFQCDKYCVLIPYYLGSFDTNYLSLEMLKFSYIYFSINKCL